MIGTCRTTAAVVEWDEACWRNRRRRHAQDYCAGWQDYCCWNRKVKMVEAHAGLLRL